MMIDKNARIKLVLILEQFMSGKITNFEFEKEIPESEDPIIWAIASSVWCLYDDFKEHVLNEQESLPQEMLLRWKIFLHSGEEYRWPVFNYPGIRPLNHGLISKLLGSEKKEREFMALGDYDVWPFIDRDSYRKEKKSTKKYRKVPGHPRSGSTGTEVPGHP